MKSITRENTIYEIYSQYPQVMDILYEFGFTQIKQPMMIQTVGRYMTLKKGCEMRGLDYEELVGLLRSKGLPVEE